ncbi:MAG: ABC transporter permease [Candidatus Symbiothrix sp.]|jgi:lipopolysaccharide transport system permease protein|nr:ABC transporter permease [Candidatus Symbiothrix sp.]
MVETEKWTTVIKPQAGWFEIDFKELRRYRDLWWMFVQRSITTSYKQTIFGPLWFFINPLLTVIIYAVVFSGIAKIPTEGIPPRLFYLAGTSMWGYFTACLNRTSGTFVANQNVFGKVYYPRLINPLASITSALLQLGIQFLLFISMYLYYYFTMDIDYAPNITLLLLPVLILMAAGMGLGFGIIISSVTTKYRDLSVFFSFVVQLWMYATPIVYPFSEMPDKYKLIAQLNPVTSLVETFRYAAFSSGTLDWGSLAYSFGFMCVILAIGILMFNRVQRSFMDTV